MPGQGQAAAEDSDPAPGNESGPRNNKMRGGEESRRLERGEMGEYGESSSGVESAGWAAVDIRVEERTRDWCTARRHRVPFLHHADCMWFRLREWAKQHRG